MQTLLISQHKEVLQKTSHLDYPEKMKAVVFKGLGLVEPGEQSYY